LLDRHDDAISRVVREVGGRLVKTTGDGALATFDGAATAVRAACAIRVALGDLGMVIRAGVHAGEVERRGDDIAGLAVHVAARVQAVAAPGEVLVTGTVADLVAGAGITFADGGLHQLKGMDGETQLLRVIAV
jgi:class 3 adenylate cyclase